MLKVILCVSAAAWFPAQAGAQGAEFLARQKLESQVSRLADQQRHDMLALDGASLMSGLGLTLSASAEPKVIAPVFVPDTGAVIELVDIRLLLTRIAIQSGAQDHAALIRAQGDREHDVILLRGGLVALSDLVDLAKGTAAEPFLSQTPEGLILTRPLAIWDDAGLSLSAADTLVLDRQSGSFVANLGWLDVTEGEIKGSAAANTAEVAFRPFVLTAGQGSFTARDARFAAMGFDVSNVFGGLAVVNSGLVEPRGISTIRTSMIADVAAIAMVGTKGSVLSGNRISGSAGTAILLSHVTNAIVAGNRFSNLTGPRAIRVTATSSDVRISGNLVSQGPRIGILVDGASNTVTLSGNVVIGSQTSGIAVREADCIRIDGNLVAMNDGTGISLADTDSSNIGANAILFNRGSGVLVRDQAGMATVRVSGNVIAGNREGLRGATSGQVELEGNKLDGQLPRLFAGDLAPLTVDWLRHRNDPVPTAQPVLVAQPLLATCDFGGNG